MHQSYRQARCTPGPGCAASWMALAALHATTAPHLLSGLHCSADCAHIQADCPARSELQWAPAKPTGTSEGPAQHKVSLMEQHGQQKPRPQRWQTEPPQLEQACAVQCGGRWPNTNWRAHCEVRPQGAKRLHICRGWHAMLAGIREVHPGHNVSLMQQQALQVVPAEVGVTEEDYPVN